MSHARPHNNPRTPRMGTKYCIQPTDSTGNQEFSKRTSKAPQSSSGSGLLSRSKVLPLSSAAFSLSKTSCEIKPVVTTSFCSSPHDELVENGISGNHCLARL